MPFMDHLNVSYLVKREALPQDKVAIQFEGMKRTYRELKDRTLRFANVLLKLSVCKNDRVAVVLYNCFEFWEINFGIQEVGAIVAPLNARLSPPEISNLIQRSGARVVIFDHEHIDHVSYTLSETKLDALICLGKDCPTGFGAYESLVAAAEPIPLNVPINPNDPAELIYTSGTTDIPKGAVWTHSAVLWNSMQQAMDYNITEKDSCYVLLGMFYIGGRHDFVMPVLHQGGTVHIRRTGGFDAADCLQYLQDHRISLVLFVHKYDISNLKMIMCGGAPVPISLIEKTLKLWPQTSFVQAYGSTEAGATVTQLKKEDSLRKIGSCGKPTLHNLIHVINEEGKPLLPYGETGEIVVKGPAVIKEYWENPEATKEALGQGWLRTGDMGRFDEEGYLYIVGRKKDMIISGGLNIYPEEIEEVFRKHPKVLDVAVIGVPNERWGEAVLVVIKTNVGQELTENEVTTYSREHLASYKKPRYVEFVDDFPRTQSGKIQKHKLRDFYYSKYGSVFER